MSRFVIALFLLVPSLAFAQALPNINSLTVRYNSQKTSANAEGELKGQLDEVDKALAEARRAGNMGEVRRQLAKGFALLGREAWTPALDYRHSLVLRTDRTVADSSLPFTMRLEQIYRPATELSPNLTATATLKQRPRAARPGAAPAAAVVVKQLATFDGVSRDLRESPLAMEVELAGVADGAYVIEAEVFDGATPMGAAALPLYVTHGLEARLRALEAAAASVPDTLRASVVYPADFIRNVNRGRISLGAFDVGSELASAEAILAAAKAGTDPFKGRTGDFERHHRLAGADEVMPYRVYVPTRYTGAAPTPLVVALHGLGGTEDSFFDQYARVPVKLAEQHGFLMAAPLGYRPDGFYGSPIMGTDPASRRKTEYSEQDVLEVVRLMKAHYNVDASRIYLMGHSMGAIGAWHLASKHPQTWAAVVAFAGTGAPALAPPMAGIPQFVVHGDDDPTVNVSGSRNMVAALKKAGAEVEYVEVAGGGHSDVVVPNLPRAFEFMGHRRRK
jgi:predicted esterase